MKGGLVERTAEAGAITPPSWHLSPHLIRPATEQFTRLRGALNQRSTYLQSCHLKVNGSPIALTAARCASTAYGTTLPSSVAYAGFERPVGNVVADIFISYSKHDSEPTRVLAEYLKEEGYSVWWDTDLTVGDKFRDVVNQELDAAKAVIVIWTTYSVTSDWVISEAQHAYRDGKLIPLCTRDLDTRQIPKPYDTLHTAVVDDREAILKAVRRRVAGQDPHNQFRRKTKPRC
jgi:hypothetical protein